MAIQDIQAYAHLSDDDVAEIGRRLEEIERRHRESLGAKDARYIHGLIRFQRGADAASRVATIASPVLAVPAASVLGLAKVLENLEIGHNVMHGQWDWMNDPEIHSAHWEWDNAGPSAGWKNTHNVTHHTYTNIIGMDNDIGYGVIRITRDRRWTPATLMQPVTNVVLASLFEYAVAFYDVELGRYFAGRQSWAETKPRLIETLVKVRNQGVKDYVAFPLLAAGAGLIGAACSGSLKREPRQAWKRIGTRARRAGQVALAANLIRNYWAYAVIFCGHFPDDVETFTKRTIQEETRAEWFLRQMLGSANFHGGKVLTVLSGNLNYQIEHHLFPNMPSNRLHKIAPEVRAIAEEFGLPYNTASFPKQFLEVQRTILKLTLPNKLLRAKSYNAPEVRADRVFEEYPEVAKQVGPRQLSKGLAMLKKMRPRFLA